jgi:hypothetical protein
VLKDNGFRTPKKNDNEKTLLWLVALVFTFSLSAQTTIPPGSVYGTWDVNGSPYIIKGDIIIDYTDQLTIEPGVEVLFDGHFYLDVQGSLTAIGNPDGIIVFTTTTETDCWNGLRFDNTNPDMNSHLAYCEISWSCKELDSACGEPESNGGAVYIRDYTKLIISNCDIHNNSAIHQGGAIAVYNSYSDEYNDRLRIEHCKIYDNYAQRSGGALSIMYGSNPRIFGNNILNNTSDKYGGGIAVGPMKTAFPSNPEISENQISRNTSAIWGGGIYICRSTPLVSSNTLYNNTSQNGGAIYLMDIDLGIVLNSLEIGSNNATENGGGLYCNDGSQFSLLNSTLEDNAAVEGAGIFIYQSDNVHINSSTLKRNNAASKGAGIYITLCTDVLINHCTFDGNEAENYGGGLFINESNSIDIYHNEIIKNDASLHSGGGIYSYYSDYKLINNLVAENTANDCAGIRLYKTPLISNIIINHNTIVNNTNMDQNPNGVSGISTTTINAPTVLNNIFTNNQYNDASFMGPNQQPHTISYFNCFGCNPNFVNGYRPGLPSVCIDIGDNSALMAPLDLDGNVRVYGNYTDLGAYEYQGVKDEPEYSPSRTQYTLDCYPNPASNNIHIKWTDRDFAPTWVGLYDISGQLVAAETINCDKPFYTLDVKYVSNGFYTLLISSNLVTKHGKIIIKH